MAQAFMIALDVLLIAMTIPGMFPEKETEKSIIRIAAGGGALKGDTDNPDIVKNEGFVGGDIPHLRLYDALGNDIGSKKGKSNENGNGLDNGAFVTRKIETDKHPEYLKITASGRDALCIAYVTMTSAAGEDYSTWNGGFAKSCGAKWYPSSVKFPGVDFKPPCVWISSDDRFLQAISIRMVDFAFPSEESGTNTWKQWHNNKDLVCESPGRQALLKKATDDGCIPYFPFSLKKNSDRSDKDVDAIIYKWETTCNPGEYYREPKKITDFREKLKQLVNPFLPLLPVNKPAARQRRELLQAQGDKCVDELVISHLDGHSARETCNDPMSWGPDFMTDNKEEKLYCDMCDHQIWPVCDENIKEHCFDADEKILKFSGQDRHIASREETALQKTYKKISTWK